MIMKIPVSSTNGYFSHDSSFIYSSDGSDVGNGDEVESPTSDGDFSEYMWMENEEEFDKEVMQQLEEEALMEQCIEAMLEDEREIRNIHNQALSAGAGAAESRQPWSNGSDSNPSELPDLCQTLDDLRVQDDLAKQSTLNPNAAEFFPQQRRQTNGTLDAHAQRST
ncbi:polyadenylate-binding protein-interacting protein 2 [Bacillus rossius redtenbacheri]|uniref:polyadenylate-binding protein-interacting protein 2 n=1 Tax=Bacillus rossius redtenbacheri TaxID=93214 RepID=UPI002FDEEB3A